MTARLLAAATGTWLVLVAVDLAAAVAIGRSKAVTFDLAFADQQPEPTP